LSYGLVDGVDLSVAMPFVVMILVLVLIYLPTFRRAGDRHPALRRIFAGDPPSALGTAFRRE
jgi:hypothetical protein